MGFRFRWSKRVLPGVRLNLGKRGASVSLGGRGFWYTIGAKGRRTTVGIPGTGLSWTDYQPYQPSAGRNVKQRAPTIDAPEEVIDSAPLDNVVAQSTSELADLLNLTRNRWRFSPAIFWISVALLLLGISFGNREWIWLSATGFLIGWPLAWIADHYRRSLKVEYELSGQAKTQFDSVLTAFDNLILSSRAWHIPSEQKTSDWKRNAGATSLIRRNRISPNLSKPIGMRANLKFPTLQAGRQILQFGPDSVLVSSGSKVIALSYSDVECDASPARFIEQESVPRDATVVGKTWRFKAKNGGPDRRFNNNYEIPICLYSEINFRSRGGLNERMNFSNPSALMFAQTLAEVSRTSPESTGDGLSAQVSLTGNKPAIAVTIFALLFALAIGMVAAGDAALRLAIIRAVNGVTEAQHLPQPMPKLNVVPNPPEKKTTSSQEKKVQRQQAPKEDPWRAFR